MFFSAYRIRSYFLGLIALATLIGAFLPSSAGLATQDGTGEPRLDGGPSDLDLLSQAIVVLDVSTGRLLLGNKLSAKLSPGTLTHMLTALVAAHDRTEDEPILITRRAASQPGVRLGLPYGVDVSLGDLLQALWYMGAGDAGMTLVEHIAGSEAAFARQARTYAVQIGAVETHIISSLGTDVAGQVTTAYDMALIGRVVLTDPLLASIAGKRRAVVEWDDVRRELLHVNPFLWQYPGATGVKSGYTEKAGYVAVASAKRSGRHLIAVVLGAPTSEARWHDLQTHLDFAFRHYATLIEEPRTDAIPYDVLTGDTLIEIASKLGVEPNVIQEWNGLDQPDRLHAGMRLWIPKQ